VYRERWWQYAEKRPELYATIAGLERVLAIPETTKHCVFSFCSPHLVFSHTVKVITLASTSHFAILASTIHEEWARLYSSTLETRLKYITTDAFETFPMPTSLELLHPIGERYLLHRHSTMRKQEQGLTKTYNRFNYANESACDIIRLRQLHVEVDRAVTDAYGWTDLDLGHGFHPTKQGVRSTTSGTPRRP
jgi:hypothetical protein